MPPSIPALPAHPEFSVIEHPGCREYRLQNPVLVNNGTSQASPFSLKFSMVFLCLAICSQTLSGVLFYAAAAVVSVILIRTTILSVLYESVILLPPHGIQLETHRGLRFLAPLFSSRHFIPSTSLDGVIINEGLSGWNVIYYLALVQRSPSQTYEMKILFRHLLPPHPILLQVYEGIHEIVLYSPTAKTENIYIENNIDELSD